MLKDNIAAILTSAARTVKVVFPRGATSNDFLRPYLFVSAYDVKVGDWVIVPAPSSHTSRGKQLVASLLDNTCAEYKIPAAGAQLLLLPNNKMPAAAVVVEVHPCVQIPDDCPYPISWLISGAINLAPYYTQLTINSKVNMLAEAAEADAEKAALVARLDASREAALAALGSYVSDALAATVGEQS
jgi:hypothetical protein